MKKIGFKPKIDIRSGHIQGYGGPGIDWTKGVYDNRRLYYVESTSESDCAIRGERERVKWARLWPSEEDFRAAVSRKKLDSPLCSNCGNPTVTGGASCLDRTWCDKPECRDALERARQEYRRTEELRKVNEVARRERERQDRVRKLDELTKCFHLRDGWFFRREEDGSVRIMHRESPVSEFLRVDVSIPVDAWASVVCSVSSAGETAERWNEFKAFHDNQALDYCSEHKDLAK